MLRKIRRFLPLIIACVLFLGSLCPALAAGLQRNGHPITVKVAFCPLDGFFEYNASGTACGYGVDYLNELKKYANINWEFVPVDSWEDTGPMMRSGKVDARMPVSEPTNPSGTFNYTVEPILSSYHAIMTRTDRTDLFYQDYSAISKMRIAIVSGLMEKTGVSDYLASIGVLSHLVYYADYNSCRAALDSGEVDGVISNIMDLTDNLKVLDRFCVTKNYISTLKNCPYYTEINDAMTQLALEDPSFQADLYKKWFPDRTTEPFTKEETEYLQKTEHLTIAVHPDRKPVSYYDEKTDSYRGIAIDIAEELSQELGVSFEYVPITTAQPLDMLETADLVMPVSKMGDDDRYFVTKSILNSEILLAVPNGREGPEEGARVGVLSTTPGIKKIVAGQPEKFQMVEYSDNRSALKALQQGKISAFANASYIVNWLLENPRYENLHVLHYQNLPIEYEICGRAGNTVLQSVLSKVIQSFPDSDREKIIKEDTGFSISDLSKTDKIYAYRGEMTVILLAVLALAAAAAWYNHTRTRYIFEIKKRGEEQEQANHAKSDFLARMSHDMRTPMNGILGLAALMQTETDVKVLQDDAGQLEMTGQYLLRLINDILDMSKIESGKLELHLKAIDSELVFRNVLTNAAQLAREKGVQLNVRTPNIESGNWVRVMADASRLEQVVMNVLSNAIKFTPAGGSVDMIMETVSITDEQVTDRYIIRDTGIGISEEFLPHIFESFSQEGRTNTEREGGTGLGMSIVKQLVDMMGGEISIKSKVNEGTEVTLLMRYPVCREEEVKEEQPREDLTVLQEKRVLLCEDHPLNAQIAARLLEKEQMLIEHAENGQDGVERFSRSAPGYYDAVLMDIRMPVMDGLEATRRIRGLNRPDAATVPIIAMTANAYQEDIKKSLEAGANAHLAKPIEPAKMYQTLAFFLRKKED